MCPNRVEELESRVQELEASVEGLTDELVECKVRIRELESAVDEDIGFAVESDTESESEEEETDQFSVGAEMVDETEPPAKSESADTPKTEGDNSENNTEESESDIIIA